MDTEQPKTMLAAAAPAGARAQRAPRHLTAPTTAAASASGSPVKASLLVAAFVAFLCVGDALMDALLDLRVASRKRDFQFGLEPAPVAPHRRASPPLAFGLLAGAAAVGIYGALASLVFLWQFNRRVRRVRGLTKRQRREREAAIHQVVGGTVFIGGPLLLVLVVAMHEHGVFDGPLAAVAARHARVHAHVDRFEQSGRRLLKRAIVHAVHAVPALVRRAGTSNDGGSVALVVAPIAGVLILGVGAYVCFKSARKTTKGELKPRPEAAAEAAKAAKPIEPGHQDRANRYLEHWALNAALWRAPQGTLAVTPADYTHRYQKYPAYAAQAFIGVAAAPIALPYNTYKYVPKGVKKAYK